MQKKLICLGLMSGTSGDGVDASVIRTDGINQYELIIEASTPSPDVPLIKPKEVYFFCIFLFIYNNFCIIVLNQITL